MVPKLRKKGNGEPTEIAAKAMADPKFFKRYPVELNRQGSGTLISLQFG
jgi:hypothetical protein